MSAGDRVGAAPAAVRLVEVTKAYGGGPAGVVALDSLSLEVPAGQLLAITGRSGSGKSTLLHVVAGIDPPTLGEVWVAGREIGRLPDDALTRLRRATIGMVHQFFNLLPTLSALENVALPLRLAGLPAAAALERAAARLEEVGLGPRAGARPHQLSGGEMQRVALARALAPGPAVVLADEPTGNLDSRSAGAVLELLFGLARRHEATVILVTHSAEAAIAADRVVELRDGRIAGDRGSWVRR